MKIAEISKYLDIPPATLRYYEDEHLIPPVHRNNSGYREYTGNDINWIYLVQCLRKAGLGINRIRQFTKLFLANPEETAGIRKQLLIDQRQQLRDQRAQIDETLEYLDYKIDHFEEHLKTFRGQLDPYIKEHVPPVSKEE